jgi:hypothetical protein
MFTFKEHKKMIYIALLIHVSSQIHEKLFKVQIKSTIIYFNCARATLICLNKNKQNGSHSTPIRDLGCDQCSPLQVLRPRIWINYKSLFGLPMLPQLCIGMPTSPSSVCFHNLSSQCFLCPQNVLFESHAASRPSLHGFHILFPCTFCLTLQSCTARIV